MEPMRKRLPSLDLPDLNEQSKTAVLDEQTYRAILVTLYMLRTYIQGELEKCNDAITP